jgi:oligopeptide/dipeptide ABC transporter ATP-binding protein
MNRSVGKAQPSSEPLLVVEDLKVRVRGRGTPRGFLAVDGVSFEVRTGETFAVVGESGCGKSTLANAIVRLIDATTGRILIKGREWSKAGGAELRRLRADVQMVFQNPYGSLNRRWSIGRAIEEPLLIHTGLDHDARRRRTVELLSLVGLGEEYFDRRPNELSGGQQQRVAIARAIACSPSLVICDEPTASLDVSIQAQVLNLLSKLQADMNLAYLLITHDLSIVRHIAQRVAVMYMGQLVEYGETEEVFFKPLHPYTVMLLDAILTDNPQRRSNNARACPDEPGDPSNPPPGCRFHPRCVYATQTCKDTAPLLERVRTDHVVACHHWRELAATPPRQG